ncbi:hypothetical protein PXH69_24465 [Rhodococcus qingshengii]|uniref:Uncharacterized protein n=1 Tax=Rhodococcus qingshengii TaxID=334542 RepID=A0AAW6LVT6_RHOSG|nr:hypothetical protein [Rhodococcus qingshengii]MDE8648125.1 hypothetical protein [Rhodococcus qingshengii]
MATKEYPFDPETGSIPRHANKTHTWCPNNPFWAMLKFVDYQPTSKSVRFIFEDSRSKARYNVAPQDMATILEHLKIEQGYVGAYWEAINRGGAFGIRPVIEKVKK